MTYLDALSAGKNPPQEINVVVEIPRGSRIKYEIDIETGALCGQNIIYVNGLSMQLWLYSKD